MLIKIINVIFGMPRLVGGVVIIEGSFQFAMFCLSVHVCFDKEIRREANKKLQDKVEAVVSVAALPMVQDNEDMAAWQEIAVSFTSGIRV